MSRLVEVLLPFDVCPRVVLVDADRFPRQLAELRAQAQTLHDHRAEARRRNSSAAAPR